MPPKLHFGHRTHGVCSVLQDHVSPLDQVGADVASWGDRDSFSVGFIVVDTFVWYVESSEADDDDVNVGFAARLHFPT